MKEEKAMRIFALKVYPGLAGEIKVVCSKTGKRSAWNDAARNGWVADANGKPFHDYYSPDGFQQELNARSKH